LVNIKNGIYYRTFSDIVYLRDVTNQNEYIYSEVAADVLNYFKTGGYDITALIDYIKNIYETDDEIDADIKEIVAEFIQEGILIDDTLLNNDEYEISEAIERITSENDILYSLCLELTMCCNQKCIHCYVDSVPCLDKELSFEEITQVIDEAYELGCFKILLTGGEVTLSPHYLEIAEYASKKGMLVDIYTNGCCLPLADFEQIVALKPNSVSVSLYGTSEIHDAITCIPGSFEKTFKTVLMLKSAGIDTYIKSVAMKQNYDNLEELYRFGKAVNIPVETSLLIGAKDGCLSCGKLSSNSCTDSCANSAEVCRINDVSKYQKLLDMIDGYSGGRTVPDRFPLKSKDSLLCNNGRTGLNIDPYGNVSPCNANRKLLGNIRTDSIKDIWKNSEARKKEAGRDFKTISKKCETCEDISFCNICIGFAERERGTDNFCQDVCMVANAKHKNFLLKKEKSYEKDLQKA
jgi:radical SAM protein with 4Fe4S-binding SPASM domain